MAKKIRNIGKEKEEAEIQALDEKNRRMKEFLKGNNQ